nr:MAG TPA: anaerobic ribonucleoside triphosphate reductase [Caudoviricetes sp.]
MTTVIKKDGAKEPFNPQKIAIAANKAAVRCDITLTDKDLSNIIKTVETKIKGLDEVPVSLLHELTIASLSANGFKDVSASYAEYRYYKTQYAKTFEKLHQDADDVLRLGDRENANFDSALVSTKGSLIKGHLTKSLYKQFYMSKQEKFLIDRGDIYAHDLRDMILGCVNCCLFDIGEVLRGGFEMSNVQYTEPKTVLSALQVIGDITLVATAQQFGGFTLPELDKVLLPYVKKSYNTAYYRYHNELGLEKERAERQARLDTIREIEQGFQSLELKLNTVPCSRGDFAFTTVSFGQWDYKNTSKDDAFWLMTIGKVILKTRREGHGKNHRPVVFPKLSFLYDKKQIDADIYSKELFDEAVKTSAQCMYPDYLSLSSKYGAVSKLFQKTGAVTSGMGCRAYLTPWANEKGQYITTGRCNIGAVSLNLPLILRIVQYQHPDDWKEAFWPELDERLEVIREFLKKRYDVIRHQKCSSNPLAFTQGGFYEGHKKPDDEVGDLVRYMTASFGITALDQATYLWEGKRMIEDQSFAVKLLKHIQAKIDEYKHEDGYLYAIYGTPAESLCATQAKQYDEWCSKIGVTNVFKTTAHYSPDYFTNSFHVNVTEEITPFEKQDKEFECFHLAQGGHIQYVRIDNPDNLEALKAVIERGMEKGFYQGVNFDSVYCNDCGQHSTNVLDKCPHCGSRNISVISRVCGYLGYTNVNGKTRMNDGKLAEIHDRKSM